MKSVLTNCILVPKKGQTCTGPENNDMPMFLEAVKQDGDFFINLDGYAIIPREEYEKLTRNKA